MDYFFVSKTFRFFLSPTTLCVCFHFHPTFYQFSLRSEMEMKCEEQHKHFVANTHRTKRVMNNSVDRFFFTCNIVKIFKNIRWIFVVDFVGVGYNSSTSSKCKLKLWSCFVYLTIKFCIKVLLYSVLRFSVPSFHGNLSF